MSDLPPPPPQDPPPEGGAQPPPPGGWPQQPPAAGGWQPQQQPPQPGGWQQPPPAAGGWQQPPPGGFQPPPQPVVVKQSSGCLKIGLILLVIVAVLGAGVVGCIVYTGNEVVKEIARSVGTAEPGDYEISEPECGTTGTGSLSATGTIKNTSDKAQAFQVTVRWVTEDNVLITDGFDYTDRLDVGQSQHWEITAYKDIPAGATPTCSISRVEYTIFD